MHLKTPTKLFLAAALMMASAYGLQNYLPQAWKIGEMQVSPFALASWMQKLNDAQSPKEFFQVSMDHVDRLQKFPNSRAQPE